MNAPPEMRRAPAKTPFKNDHETTSTSNPTTTAAQINAAHEAVYNAVVGSLESMKRVGDELFLVYDVLNRHG